MLYTLINCNYYIIIIFKSIYLYIYYLFLIHHNKIMASYFTNYYFNYTLKILLYLILLYVESVFL